MDVSKHEAQESLEAIQQTTAQMRKAIVSGGSPYYVILWGAIWFLGFLSSHFFRNFIQVWIWWILVILGIVFSIYLGIRTSSRIRTRGDRNVGILWMAIMAYTGLLLLIAQPSSEEQGLLLSVTFMMFGYVVMGLWLERAVAWTGLIITALAIVGYYLFFNYYFLWMAFLVGSTLMFSGFYMLRKWK